MCVVEGGNTGKPEGSQKLWQVNGLKAQEISKEEAEGIPRIGDYKRKGMEASQTHLFMQEIERVEGR